MTGYSHVCECRPHKTGGGVSLLINNRVNYTVRNDLNIVNTSIEGVFVEIDQSQVESHRGHIQATWYIPGEVWRGY